MRHALLLVLLVLTAASPAAAQSCATLGGQLDCGGAAKKAKAPAEAPPPGSQSAVMDGHAETTVSNRGTSTTLENRVIDSHGVFEFGVGGTIGTRCRHPGYGSLC